MANIKSFEIGTAVSNYDKVELRKSLFGLSASLVYKPTQSKIKAYQYEYTPAEGDKVEKLLNTPLASLPEKLKSVGNIEQVAIGHVRAEVCMSADRQFLALCLYRFYDSDFHPSTDLRIYEGIEAELVSKIF